MIELDVALRPLAKAAGIGRRDRIGGHGRFYVLHDPFHGDFRCRTILGRAEIFLFSMLLGNPRRAVLVGPRPWML